MVENLLNETESMENLLDVQIIQNADILLRKISNTSLDYEHCSIQYFEINEVNFMANKTIYRIYAKL